LGRIGRSGRRPRHGSKATSSEKRDALLDKETTVEEPIAGNRL
jgi:hypothetical protein